MVLPFKPKPKDTKFQNLMIDSDEEESKVDVKP